VGIALGASQFISNGMFAVLFGACMYLINFNKALNPLDVFLAMFALLFSAMHFGNATAMGPDAGKATAAL
jgi:hypothetical protein